jgi:16S rRNA (guanine527-N7)-methyltransferase
MALEPLGSRWDPLVLRAAQALRTRGVASVECPSLAPYLDELVRWNARTDLTAARTPEELVDVTLADAAVLATASASGAPGSWVDVGSGAGAPGLVLSILLPAIRMTLVEPRGRRVAFLRSTVGALALSRVTVERGRSDRLPPQGWDTAVSRATLPPPEWLVEGSRLARSAVWLLLARDEPPSLEGFRIDADIRYEWPLTSAPRRAVRYVPAEATGVMAYPSHISRL